MLALALFSSAAMALGLGNIRVLSKPGQPLMAEIPVISADPGELENAHVTLASPATFERVGLPPPQGLVNELQFTFAQDREGRAVIRVTSAAPVTVPAVGFLIEVDWGQGRLVREYSALVAAPETATAVAEPVIEAPAAAPSNLITREPQPLQETPEAPVSTPAAPSPAPVPVAARPAPAPAPVAAPAPQVGDSTTVRRGQSLSQIAQQLAQQSGSSVNQTMVALLNANPEAFIRGNINLLKEGAVLRTPAQEELARVNAAEAHAIVQQQTAQWRQARAAIPQPAVADAAAAPAARNNQNAAAPQGARLEIAPAVAGGQQTAGMTTGLDAGGEGDMAANEQLRQAKEDLATRDAELQELRERVGELENLQKQQQSLIAMKDSDMAAAQQRLAEAAKRDGGGSMAWLWLGLALVIGAGLGWLLSRRRKPSPLPAAPRGGFAADELAAGMAVGGAGLTAAQLAEAQEQEAYEADEPFEAEAEAEGEEVETYAAPVADAPAAEPLAYEDPMPAWLRSTPVAHVAPVEPTFTPTPTPEAPAAPAAGPRPVLLFEEALRPTEPLLAEVEPEPEAVPEPEPDFRGVFDPPASEQPAWTVNDMAAVTPLNPTPAGRERLELAIAYLDLGDAETARTLLAEVARGGDLQARNEALELLARLG